jgi:hypothetical protein
VYGPQLSMAVVTALPVVVLLACSQAGRNRDQFDQPDPEGSAPDTGGVTLAPADTVWVRAVAGYSQSCGQLSTGAWRCWGADVYGILDIPTVDLIDLQLGGGFACGLDRARKVVCWGCYGWDDRACTQAPVEPAIELSAGAHHACVTTLAGDLRCWGADPTAPPWVPAPVDSFSVAEHGTCLLHSTPGVPDCWGGIGWNADGSLDHVPDPPEGFEFVGVETGQNHVCGLTAEGHAMCWGESNGAGIPVVPAPVDVVFARITSTAFDTCGLRASDGHAVCWGPNHLGEPTWPGYVPTPDLAFADLSVGEYHACGVVAGGREIVCWGLDRDGDTRPPPLDGAIPASAEP